jgi:hypothetical protein
VEGHFVALYIAAEVVSKSLKIFFQTISEKQNSTFGEKYENLK